MEQADRSLLEQGLQSYGIETSSAMLEAILGHLALVAEWNERINLTAITERREMVIKHALDSASALRLGVLRPGDRVLDVGTGAGFPGVTWKLIAPSIRLVLLESLQKRCRFLEEVGQQIVQPYAGGLGDYQVAWGRAEDLGRAAEHRESYDLVTARAVAELRVLAEYCLPFVKIGGLFVAMKGPNLEAEVEVAGGALRRLGGQLERVEEFDLPEEGGRRSLVVIRKVKVTPREYPRKAGTPSKSPL